MCFQDTEHLLNHSVLLVPSLQNDSVDQVLHFPLVHEENPADYNGGQFYRFQKINFISIF